MINQNHPLPTVAILGGTGKEGPGLAMRWAGAGYTLIIGSRQAEKAQATAQDLNAKLGVSSITGMENGQAARRADISVLTVVYSAHQSALEGLREDLDGKILVDATARVDFRNPVPPAPPAAARVAQDILGPGVRVVAAFQNVPAHALKRDLSQPVESAVLVCSDDIPAAEEVIALARAGGMHAYFAGGLDNAVVVEGITSLMISINQHYGVRSASIGITGLLQDVE
ncbi:MAG: NADPH-dependent F420 reductase [Chloroflexota bacterium]|nr:MAG: NADPH-dependent F420 reductase [Chloroflexota bacterium]